MPTEKKKLPCRHWWVNYHSGCLLCGKSWEELNKEGIYIKVVRPKETK